MTSTRLTDLDSDKETTVTDTHALTPAACAELRILELHPEHFTDPVTCLLCGAFGVDVGWFAAWSPENLRTLTTAHRVVARFLGDVTDPDSATLVDDLTVDLAATLDPDAARFGDDFAAVCPDCATADSAALRARIRAHADQLDEAGYGALYGPDSDDLTDRTLRDRGRWVRRHVGYELAVTPNPADESDLTSLRSNP